MRRFLMAAALALALGGQALAADGGFISNFGWINDLWEYFRPSSKKLERPAATAQNATAPGGYKQAIEAVEAKRKAETGATK